VCGGRESALAMKPQTAPMASQTTKNTTVTMTLRRLLAAIWLYKRPSLRVGQDDGACAGWVPSVTVIVSGLEPRCTVSFTT
jgi:hypothetical protein